MFTAKERDAETGLDFFDARYYSSAQGRFTSPDEFKGGIVDPFTDLEIETNSALPYADITDPQTLNKYGYVRNNPLRYTDPDGHGILDWVKSAACAVGISSECAQPQPQKTDQKQQLVNAQDSAMANPAFQPTPGGATHCNQATCAIVKQVGAPTGPLTDQNGNPVLANQQARNLANSNQYKEVTPEQAQQIANNGGLVVVAYDPPRGAGHTATVRPEGVPGDNPRSGTGPLLNDIGRSTTVQHQNWAFTRNAEVHYYTPTGK